jgi:YVTN family beta-propeller protein
MRGLLRGAAVAVLAVGATFMGSVHAGGQVPAAVAASRAPVVFVTLFNADEVVAINTASRVGRVVAVGHHPFGIALTPNGRTAYVTNQGSDTVTPIDVATMTAAAAIPVGRLPGAIAVAPDGRTVYVANGDETTITPIHVATGIAAPVIQVGGQPAGLAITPNGKTLYVTDSFIDAVTPINLATRVVGTAIPVGHQPFSEAITPDGTMLYVVSYDGMVTPISTDTDKPGTPIRVGSSPFSIAVTPNGRTAWVVDYLGCVFPISLATGTRRQNFCPGLDLVGVAFTPDGKKAWITDIGVPRILDIDVATHRTEFAASAGGSPTFVAVTPDQAPHAVLTVTPAARGNPTLFDASASTVKYGTITKYAWNFGDGTSARTTASITTHIYAKAGRYTARVTETDSAGTSTMVVFTGQTASRNGGPAARTSTTFTITCGHDDGATRQNGGAAPGGGCAATRVDRER